MKQYLAWLRNNLRSETENQELSIVHDINRSFQASPPSNYNYNLNIRNKILSQFIKLKYDVTKWKFTCWGCNIVKFLLYYKILNSHEAHIHQHWEAVSKRSTQQHNVQTAHCHHRHYLMKSYESKQCKDFAAFYSCLARPNNSTNLKQKGKNAILRFIKNFSLSSKTL